MKKGIIVFVLMAFITISGFAQQRGPGNPSGDPTGNDPIGGGAPIGSGAGILIGLGVIYLGRKIYANTKIELEE